ncbi:MAG: hypothetical protein ACRD4U_03725 [Candidatus Acidiferrales bacterium]
MTEGINRQAFVRQHEEKRREPNLLAPLFFVIVGLGLLGVAGYMYVRANGMPEFGSPQPDLSEVVARLEEIEQRLGELEKRRSSAPARPPQETASAPAPVGGSSPAAAPASQSSAPKPAAGVVSGEPATSDKEVAELRDRVRSLHGDVAQAREAWDASTDQLGTVAGVLSKQQSEIESNRQRLMSLSDRFERTPIAFDLRKNNRQRVGPIWLSLHKTHEKTQRYTLRAFIEDKSIELKDRALLEPVELYLSEATTPLELVVTDIQDERVSGILRVPKPVSSR